MARFQRLSFLLSLCVLMGLVVASAPGWAQPQGPVLVLHPPDPVSSPPEVRIYASVLDPDLAQSIEGLGIDNFQVKESETSVALTDVIYQPVGLAVVLVVDRGGIAAPGDTRIKEAIELARALLDRLSITQAPEDDIVAIVGIGEGGELSPTENFTYNPVDRVLVENALTAMEGVVVRGPTPLYDGLDEALRLLTSNPDSLIRDVLTHRRKVIVVFSDGIDREFSDQAREEDIIRKANGAGISLYTIGMAQRRGTLTREGEVSLSRLASQTGGKYQIHNSDQTYQEVLALFDRLMTQRNQYVLTYITRQPKGTYTLRVSVNTDTGSAEKSISFDSKLEPPQLVLTAPSDGLEVTVPYSSTAGGYTGTLVLSVQVIPRDGIPRNPTEVRYFANGVRIGSSTAAPTYEFPWDLGNEVSPSLRAPSREYTLQAEADDPYLGTRLTSGAVTVRIRWEELPIWRRALLWLASFWWILLLVVILGIGLLVLLALLLRTRSQVAQRIVTGTTGVLKGVTRRLGATPPASAKLIVVKGSNVGREIPLSAPVTKVARDPQFGDFALYDEYVSNPHFSVHQEQTQFYIVDEGSTNGTRVNGMPVPPHTRIVLQPDAIIEVGMTRLQFKRVGGTTRQLQQPGIPATPPAPPYPGPVPPTQPAPPYPPGAGPVPPTPPGGPTKKVP